MATPPLPMSVLDVQRTAVEKLIADTIMVRPFPKTDDEFARYHERLHHLHESLVTVLEQIERASWYEAPCAAGALRWAVTGARLVGEGHRDASIQHRELASGTAAR